MEGMSGNAKDLRISTMQAITKVLVNGTWGQYPCVMAATGIDASEVSAAQCAKLLEENERLKDEHKAKIQALRSAVEKEINFLKEQVKFQEEQMIAKDKLLEKITNLIEAVRKQIKQKTILKEPVETGSFLWSISSLDVQECVSSFRLVKQPVRRVRIHIWNVVFTGILRCIGALLYCKR